MSYLGLSPVEAVSCVAVQFTSFTVGRGEHEARVAREGCPAWYESILGFASGIALVPTMGVQD